MNEKIQLPQDDIEDAMQLTDEISHFILATLEDHEAQTRKNVLLGVFATVIINNFKVLEGYNFLEKLVAILQGMVDEDIESGENGRV